MKPRSISIFLVLLGIVGIAATLGFDLIIGRGRISYGMVSTYALVGGVIFILVGIAMLWQNR